MLMFLLTACGSIESADLLGFWTAEDEVTKTVFFEDSATEGFTYMLEDDGALLQSGTYVVSDEVLINVDGAEKTLDNVLVWTVGFDASGQVTPGTSFGDPIYSLQGDEMVLRSATAANGRRTWLRE